MRRVASTIAHPNVTLIRGFFNESLPRMHLAHLRPALYVDIDSDLYISARDCLQWLFHSGLMEPGTLVRYDDWKDGRDDWGEMKAHREITDEFDVVWRQVDSRWGVKRPNPHNPFSRSFEVMSIG